MSHIVHLTGPQAEWVRWALDGPMSEWDDPEALAYDHDISLLEARRAILTRDVIRLEGTTLHLPEHATPDEEAIDALLNMLETLAPDITMVAGLEEYMQDHDEAEARLMASRKARCAVNAANRIRKAIG